MGKLREKGKTTWEKKCPVRCCVTEKLCPTAVHNIQYITCQAIKIPMLSIVGLSTLLIAKLVNLFSM